MLQLVAKDILIQKRTFLLSFLYVAIMIISFQSFGEGQGSAMLPAGVVAITYILVLTACALDDKNKADILLNSLPLGRHLVVMARYLSVMVFAALGVVDYVIITSVINLANIPIKTHPVTLEGIIAAFFAVSVIVSIYLPVFFKLGYIKSKIYNFLVFFGIFFGIGAVSSLIEAESENTAVKGVLAFLTGRSDTQIALGIVAIMLLMLVCSYLLSVKFYKNREF